MLLLVVRISIFNCEFIDFTNYVCIYIYMRCFPFDKLVIHLPISKMNVKEINVEMKEEEERETK